jgi:hypothetical protein
MNRYMLSRTNANFEPLDVAIILALLTSLLVLYTYRFGSPLGAIWQAARTTTLLTYGRGGPTAPFNSTAAAYSRQRAVNTFTHYATLSKSSHSIYSTPLSKLSTRHRALAQSVGYDAKLQRIDWAERENASLARDIARFAEEQFGMTAAASTRETNFDRATEALRHLVRDWSEDGREERQETHGPILQALVQAVAPDDRSTKKVLVPGCGLGRLAWEISQLGRCVHLHTRTEISHTAFV